MWIINMQLDKDDLLFIHDSAKRTLPFLKQVLKSDDGDNEFAEAKVKTLENLRIKCRTALIDDHKSSGEFLDADR